MADKFGEYINVSDSHVSIGVVDSVAAYTAPTPELLAPSASVAQEPQTSTKIRYYSGKPRYTTSTEGETKVTIVIPGMPLNTAARVLGKGYDSANSRMIDNGDANSAPYCAYSFAAPVEGGVKYFQFLKGKFAPYKEEAESSDKDIKEKTTTLEYTALVTEYMGFKLPNLLDSGYHAGPCKRIVADSREDATLTEAEWFGEVQKPDAYVAPSALSLTSAPAANATAVIVSIKPALTFNNAIADYSGISLIKADGSVVSATIAIDNTNKIITITPAANLTAATAHYIVLSGITDVYGQVLATTSSKFTTA